MKTFDLEAAKRGAAVCTRDGKPAKIISFNASCHAGSYDNPIIAEVTYEHDLIQPRSYIINGQEVCYETEGDLMMRDDDYLQKLERGEYGNHIEGKREMVETNEFEKHPRLTEYIRTMATTGQLPSNWSEFIAALNEGLATTTDHEYWRRVYAGRAMQGFIASTDSNAMPDAKLLTAECVKFADALIAELEKTK